MDRDLELIRQFKQGDEKAFNELVLRNALKAHRLIYNFVRNRQDAEDLSQELWIKVYGSVKKFRGDSLFYTWLYRIAVNLCNRFLKRSRRHLMLEDLNRETAEGADNQLRELEGKETARKIEKAIRALPKKQRAVFILRNYEGLHYDRISEILGIGVSSAKTNHFHAVNKLQGLLEKEGIIH